MGDARKLALRGGDSRFEENAAELLKATSARMGEAAKNGIEAARKFGMDSASRDGLDSELVEAVLR